MYFDIYSPLKQILHTCLPFQLRVFSLPLKRQRPQTSMKQTREKRQNPQNHRSDKKHTHTQSPFCVEIIATTRSTHTWNPFCVGQILSSTGVPCPGVWLIHCNSINENWFLSPPAGINLKKAYWLRLGLCTNLLSSVLEFYLPRICAGLAYAVRVCELISALVLLCLEDVFFVGIHHPGLYNLFTTSSS